MIRKALSVLAVVAAVAAVNSAAWSEPKDIRWGTPPVGTAGHKALVTLANILNKEMPDYRISVLPTAGAIATVKGYATKELDGFYGSDIAFHELATDSNRFKGFKARVQRGLAAGRALAEVCRENRVWGEPRQSLVGRAARTLGRPFLTAALSHAARIDRIVKGVAKGDAWDEMLQLGLRFAAKP